MQATILPLRNWVGSNLRGMVRIAYGVMGYQSGFIDSWPPRHGKCPPYKVMFSVTSVNDGVPRVYGSYVNILNQRSILIDCMINVQLSVLQIKYSLKLIISNVTKFIVLM